MFFVICDLFGIWCLTFEILRFMEAIILAGGFGTRLKKLGFDIPKPMIDVGGRPFLEYILLYLRHHGVGRVIFSVGYKKEVIRAHFGELFRGMWIDYAEEKEPMGTGGGILKAMSLCREEQVWVLNGDTFFEVELPAMYAFHVKEHAMVTLAGKKMERPGRYGIIQYDDQMRITAFREKDPAAQEGVINGGVYLIDRGKFMEKPFPVSFSMEHDFLEPYVAKEKFMLYLSDGYFIDIGIPEDLERARHDSNIFKRYE